MLDVLARARRAAKSREEAATRTLRELRAEEEEEGRMAARRESGSSEADAVRRAAMPERKATADEVCRSSAQRRSEQAVRAEAEVKVAAWRVAEAQGLEASRLQQTVPCIT